jgi:hypothetical protein
MATVFKLLSAVRYQAEPENRGAALAATDVCLRLHPTAGLVAPAIHKANCMRRPPMTEWRVNWWKGSRILTDC